MSIKVVLRVEYQLKHSQDPLTKEEIVNTKVTYCKKMIVMLRTMTKLLQFYTGFLRCIKPPLVQDLVLFLKLVARNHYLMLFQKYLK